MNWFIANFFLSNIVLWLVCSGVVIMGFVAVGMVLMTILPEERMNALRRILSKPLKKRSK